MWERAAVDERRLAGGTAPRRLSGGARFVAAVPTHLRRRYVGRPAIARRGAETCARPARCGACRGVLSLHANDRATVRRGGPDAVRVAARRPAAPSRA